MPSSKSTRKHAAADKNKEYYETTSVLVDAARDLDQRAQIYPEPPEKGNLLMMADVLAHKRAIIQYEATRARVLGYPFHPPCSKCSGRQSCLIDITGLLNGRRKFRCAACITGKAACSSEGAAREAHLKHRRLLDMGQYRGFVGQEWKVQELLHAKQIRKKKRAHMDRELDEAKKFFDKNFELQMRESEVEIARQHTYTNIARIETERWKRLAQELPKIAARKDISTEQIMELFDSRPVFVYGERGGLAATGAHQTTPCKQSGGDANCAKIEELRKQATVEAVYDSDDGIDLEKIRSAASTDVNAEAAAGQETSNWRAAIAKWVPRRVKI